MSGKSDNKPARKVGYQSPPEDHKFKPGNKRNPWGRNGKPKPAIAFLDVNVEVTIDGKKTRRTRREVTKFALFKVVAGGGSPAVSAAKLLFELDKSNAKGTSVEADNEPLPEQDSAALERYVARQLQIQKSPVEKPARKRRKTP
jgi:hypothetical protein